MIEKGNAKHGVGRPSINAIRINITLPFELVEWLKSKGKVSEIIRNLVEEEMKKEIS